MVAETNPFPIGTPEQSRRGFAFWMVFVGNLVVDLLSALDLTAVSTALPTIVEHLHGTDFIWAGSAYTIASTAILPTVGGLVSVFGRKPVLLTFVVIFAVGSALCGGARSMNMFIAGRVVQGLGGGGCISVTEIIYADLVPLPERGKFLGITASVWALACAIGPPIGGALANSGAWRWLFFLNLPLCGIALALVTAFLNVHIPKASFMDKISGMDWLGLFIIISSTMSIMIALTWAGIRYTWVSVHVLVPLCLGAVGLIVFFVLDVFWIRDPTIPPFVLNNRTTLSGYLGTFFHGIASMAVIFYLPVYFQASKADSPVQSGVELFGLAFVISPVAIFTGASVQIFHRYRPQNYVGWMLTMVGFGLLSTLEVDSSKGKYIGYQVITGIGLGIIWIGTQFPILAPLPFSNNAHALAFFTFIRCFAQVWGTVIGGAILQNVLRERLPATFVSTLPSGTQLAYSIIPEIRYLPLSLKAEVQAAFAQSTAIIWRVMIGVSGLGLLSCLLMREIAMRTSMDEQWGLQEHKGRDDEPEKAEIA
ncbi:hypothetical protein POSPLADRAFT_1141525 [Postia placenta MAD-698-R-SB12]|uniref:Major facilitator superfamily (MFS) profile domain-containing protein n=1 Tax=Postia placenta MAD-698-R-SB12 TaxID=670580 RepID=A0A1X6N200_9APHY|nr:hypothetical protein POSPLADRAFT_1141525 [Postia placenta MAD-698-R-SB12]OSX62647.1 hypothetical protein POSPLADRAFT_1141525 [Postia placenta MAD-698-R-SB12]